MTSPLRIWTDGLCTDSRGFGGWAFVRVWNGEARGAAGGERQATTPRMELTAVARALADLGEIPPATPLMVHSDSLWVTAGAGQLAGWEAKGWIDAQGEPVACRDLWEEIAAIAATRPLSLVRVSPTPADRKPAGFVAAWSEFAREKCKASGAFTSPIPKPNLSKFPGLVA